MLHCLNCDSLIAEQDLVCLSCGAKPPAKRTKTLNTNFTLFTICWTVAGLTALFLALMVLTQGRNADGVRPLILIFLIAYFSGGILMCMLHYRLWKLIPKDVAQTTPGKAVGFMFIPFFNFYWISVSYLGLSKGLTEMLRHREIQSPISHALSITFGILFVIPASTWEKEPTLIVLHVLLQCIVGILFYRSAKNGAVALLKHGKEETQERDAM